MDDGRVDDGMTIEDLAKELRLFREHVDTKFESIDRRFESIDRKFESMDQKLESKTDSLDARMRIGFEETHRLIKMGFESVQILDEKIDRRFNETERQHADHKTLIEAAIKRLSRDAQRPRGPALRRRR